MTIALTTPDYYARQQVGGNATFNLEGTYSGTPTTIEYSSDGATFFTGDATPTGGTFDFPITLAVGQYTVTVRFSNDVGDNDSITFVTVGDGFLVCGQSNPSGRGDNNQTYAQGTYKAILLGNDDVFKEIIDPTDSNVDQVDIVSSDANAAGSWIMRLADKWAGGVDTPMFFIPCAKGGTTIAQWEKGTGLYDSSTRRAALTGGVSRVIFQLGGSDAFNLTLASTYESKLNGMCDDYKADVGADTLIMALQQLNSTSDGDGVTTGQVPIRNAQINVAATNSNVEITAPLNGINLPIDGVYDVHFVTNSELDQVAQAAYNSLANITPITGYGFTRTLPTVTGVHTDFPVLLDVNTFPIESINGGETSIFSGGGNLIAYEDSTKAVRLPVEVVSFITGMSPIAVVWIKTTAQTGETIYIESDDTQTEQPAVTDAYGRNAVWSLYEQVSHDGVTDSTGNYPDEFTVNGGVTTVLDRFGELRAKNFPIGNTQSIDVDVSSRDPIESLTGSSAITLEVAGDDVGSSINQRIITMHGSTTNFAALGFNYGALGTGVNFFIGANDSNATDTAHGMDVDNTAPFMGGGSMSLNATTVSPILVFNGVAGSIITGANLGDGSTSRSLRFGARNDNNNGAFAIGYEFRYGQFESSEDRLIANQLTYTTSGAWGSSSAWVDNAGSAIEITPGAINSSSASNDPVIQFKSIVSLSPLSIDSSSVAINPVISFESALNLTPSAIDSLSTSNDPVINYSSALILTPSVIDSASTSLDPVIAYTSALTISPSVIDSLSESLDPLIEYKGVINLFPQSIDSLSASLNPIISTGEVQTIGNVTAGFADDLYSVKYKLSGITVNFK